MSTWINDNWLALYGAFVGTVALGINFSRVWIAINKDKIRLRIEHCRRHDYDDKIKALQESLKKEPWERLNLVEVYTIIVKNIGCVDAYIEQAWIVDGDNVRHDALVPERLSRGVILNRLDSAQLEPVKAKSSSKFTVYLHADERPFEAKECRVMDRTGKIWKSCGKAQVGQ